MIFCNNCIACMLNVKRNPIDGRRRLVDALRRHVLFRERDPCSFIVYGASIHEASFMFEKTLKDASPLNDYVELSDGKQVKVGSNPRLSHR